MREKLKWWWRRLYMPIFYKKWIVSISLTADNKPGDIWTDPQGIRFIYMGKNMYAIMREDDEV